MFVPISIPRFEDVEEIDNSTLDGKDVIRIPTGLTNVYITTYKKV
jgi:hypothetical protein